jgi:hypothetical protein
MKARRIVIAVVGALAASHVGWNVHEIVRANELSELQHAPNKDDVLSALGEPDARTTGQEGFLGLTPCQTMHADSIEAHWFRSPYPYVYPAIWVFCFEKQGRGVAKYRFASP